jgi:hypothetical protein
MGLSFEGDQHGPGRNEHDTHPVDARQFLTEENGTEDSDQHDAHLVDRRNPCRVAQNDDGPDEGGKIGTDILDADLGEDRAECRECRRQDCPELSGKKCWFHEAWHMEDCLFLPMGRKITDTSYAPSKQVRGSLMSA